MKNNEKTSVIHKNNSVKEETRKLLNLKYIFSRYQSFTDIKHNKMKSLFNRQLKPLGI